MTTGSGPGPSGLSAGIRPALPLPSRGALPWPRGASLRSALLRRRPGNAAVALLDRLLLPVGLLRGDGTLLYANPALRALAGRRFGVALGPRGRLDLADAGAARSLAAALHACLRPGAAKPAVIPVRRAGSPALLLHLHPLPTGGALLQLVEPPSVAAEMPRPARLRLMFGLTPAEAALAELLAEGVPPAAAAERRGVGMPTVRTQIRALLAKTGAARLHELTALLARAAR